jgi:uncharacterized protein (DUF983 family)
MAKPTKVAPLIPTALRGRCPRCGQGSVFAGYIRVAPNCPVCGLSLAGHDTGDGPAFFIMLPLCILTAVSALLLDRLASPPLWVHMVVWPIFIAAVVGLSLRPVKATMIALQYRYRDMEKDASDTPSVS